GMFKQIIIAILFALSATFAAGAPATAPSGADDSGEAALAEEFAQMAHLQLATRAITPAVWHEAIAMFKAAAKLNPDEPRFWRMLAEAAAQDHNDELALSSLQAYSRLVPDD